MVVCQGTELVGASVVLDTSSAEEAEKGRTDCCLHATRQFSYRALLILDSGLMSGGAVMNYSSNGMCKACPLYHKGYPQEGENY